MAVFAGWVTPPAPWYYPIIDGYALTNRLARIGGVLPSPSQIRDVVMAQTYPKGDGESQSVKGVYFDGLDVHGIVVVARAGVGALFRGGLVADPGLPGRARVACAPFPIVTTTDAPKQLAVALTAFLVRDGFGVYESGTWLRIPGTTEAQSRQLWPGLRFIFDAGGLWLTQIEMLPGMGLVSGNVWTVPLVQTGYPVFGQYQLVARQPAWTSPPPTVSNVLGAQYTASDGVTRPVYGVYFGAGGVLMGIVLERVPRSSGSLWAPSARAEMDPGIPGYARVRCNYPPNVPLGSDAAWRDALQSMLVTGRLMDGVAGTALKFPGGYTEAESRAAWGSALFVLTGGVLWLTRIPPPADGSMVLAPRYGWGRALVEVALGNGAAVAIRPLWVGNAVSALADDLVIRYANVTPTQAYRDNDPVWNDADHATPYRPWMGFGRGRYAVPSVSADTSNRLRGAAQPDPQVNDGGDGFYVRTRIEIPVFKEVSADELEAAVQAALRAHWGVNAGADLPSVAGLTPPSVDALRVTTVLGDVVYRVGPYTMPHLPPCVRPLPKTVRPSDLTGALWRRGATLRSRDDGREDAQVFVAVTADSTQWFPTDARLKAAPFRDVDGALYCVTNIHEENATIAGEVSGVLPGTDPQKAACARRGKRYAITQYAGPTLSDRKRACVADVVAKGRGRCLVVQNDLPGGDDVVGVKEYDDATCGDALVAPGLTPGVWVAAGLGALGLLLLIRGLRRDATSP